jgi:hypothetical protein
VDTALLISTPDGSGQPVHPDVVDTVTGFAGHRYWMACTPYPYGDDRLENPIIRVSPDGLRWQPVAGAPDPLVPTPAAPDEHWSDTDLVIHDGMLHVIFRGCRRGDPHTTLWVMRSADGVDWTTPERFWEGDRAVSPALVRDTDGWSMWHVEADSTWVGQEARLVRHRGADLQHLSDRTVCGLAIPGHVLWHLDVIATDEGFEALAAAYPQRSNAARCRLFHAVSTDGVTFTLTQVDPVLRPRLGRWDSKVIYRSTFVKDADGGYRVWFAAGAWSRVWGIGYAAGPIAGLRRGGGATRAGRGPRDLVAELRGAVEHVAQYRLPQPLKKALRAARGVTRGG